jgi:hypothetical protein
MFGDPGARSRRSTFCGSVRPGGDPMIDRPDGIRGDEVDESDNDHDGYLISE